MARERGTFNFSASLEPKKQGALDARLVVQTYAELTKTETWADSDSKVWLYDGMIVSVVADTTDVNGVYMLSNKDNYTQTSSWIRVDAKAAYKTEIVDNLTSTSTTAALSANQGKVLKDQIDAHEADVNNPHNVTAAQLNIDSSLVGVTAAELPVSTATQAELDKKVDKVTGKSLVDDTQITKLTALKSQTEITADINAVQTNLDNFKNTKGQANGLASLDENGLVPAAQLPSYVDDVVEAANYAALPTSGESGKIYVTLDNNLTYRWSGSQYVEISKSLALGETDSTAYAGSKGKANAEAIAAHVARTDNPHNVTAAQLNIDASLVGKTAAQLPVSTATQTELDKKVDKVSGKSLVADDQITKLTALKSQAELNSDIADAKKAGTDADASAKAVTGQSTGAYVANSSANYINAATSLTDADNKLDAQVKANADKLAELAGSGSGSVADQISSAVDGLKGTASADYDTLGEVETAIKGEVTARENADKAITDSIGTSADASTANTVYGTIKKESEARAAADKAINDEIGDKASGTIEATTLWGAIEELESEAKTANDAATALTGRVTTAEGKIAANETNISQNASDISALSTAVDAFKNKTVATSVTTPGSDTALPTTKAVVDYIKSATDGVANRMTYTAKAGDDSKMELKLIAVDDSVLSTIEMDKENFLSGFVKREATAEDVAADGTLTLGDPILVVTLTNGNVFRVSLKSLVDVYTGQTTNSIVTTVDGYKVKSELKLDSTTQNSNAVKLAVGTNGLSADLSLDATKNGANGVNLSKSGDGLAAALKIDTATNAANGVEVTVGANGLSVGITWTEL